MRLQLVSGLAVVAVARRTLCSAFAGPCRRNPLPRTPISCLILAGLILLWGAAAQAGPGCLPERQGIMRQAPATGACLLAGVRAAEPQEEPGKGCCSWHGGQCGCAKGRVVCCDGTVSPTCRCHSADQPLSGAARSK